MHDPELAAWIRLSLVPGLGDRTLRRLLGALGLPSQVLASGPGAVAQVVGADLAQRMFGDPHEAAVATALDWAARPGNRLLTLADADYPRRLLEISDPPALLWCRGDARLLSRPGLAVVGSRNATPQGLSNAEQFARAFSDAGLVITSGLALGIDAAAHRGGLAGRSSTIAVLGTGADVAYPARNRALYDAIAERGVIVSEFPLGTVAAASNFPRRNRIICGLALGVLVVEAAMESGSLITARLAGEQGRELFAIPGSIKDGAKLVESAQDVLSELRIESPFAEPSQTSPARDTGLLAWMGHDPCSIDVLAQRSGLTPDVVSAMLLALELEGKVAGLPGGRYQRTAGS
jgi:DNA processing protein